MQHNSAHHLCRGDLKPPIELSPASCRPQTETIFPGLCWHHNKIIDLSLGRIFARQLWRGPCDCTMSKKKFSTNTKTNGGVAAAGVGSGSFSYAVIRLEREFMWVIACVRSILAGFCGLKRQIFRCCVVCWRRRLSRLIGDCRSPAACFPGSNANADFYSVNVSIFQRLAEQLFCRGNRTRDPKAVMSEPSTRCS